MSLFRKGGRYLKSAKRANQVGIHTPLHLLNSQIVQNRAKWKCCAPFLINCCKVTKTKGVQYLIVLPILFHFHLALLCTTSLIFNKGIVEYKWDCPLHRNSYQSTKVKNICDIFKSQGHKCSCMVPQVISMLFKPSQNGKNPISSYTITIFVYDIYNVLLYNNQLCIW